MWVEACTYALMSFWVIFRFSYFFAVSMEIEIFKSPKVKSGTSLPSWFNYVEKHFIIIPFQLSNFTAIFVHIFNDFFPYFSQISKQKVEVSPMVFYNTILQWVSSLFLFCLFCFNLLKENQSLWQHYGVNPGNKDIHSPQKTNCIQILP